MASPGREGPAGPRLHDCAIDYARDSDSSLWEPESLDKGDLPPHRVLGQGGVFPQKPLRATVPLSGTLSPLDSTSTKVGTPVGLGMCETLVKHVSDSTKWRSDRDSAHGETMSSGVHAPAVYGPRVVRVDDERRPEVFGQPRNNFYFTKTPHEGLPDGQAPRGFYMNHINSKASVPWYAEPIAAPQEAGDHARDPQGLHGHNEFYNSPPREGQHDERAARRTFTATSQVSGPLRHASLHTPHVVCRLSPDE